MEEQLVNSRVTGYQQYKVGTCWIHPLSGTEALLAQSPLHIPTGPFEDRIIFRDAFIIRQSFWELLENVPAVPCQSKIL